jgi:hypothetical protein
MRIEIVKTLKCATVWKKGTVFDDTDSPIPGDVLKELSIGSGTVRKITAEKPIAVVEPEIEIKEPVEPIPEEPVKVAQESTPKFTFPELEGLIKKYTSIKAVSELLNVSQQTVSRWRSGKSKPKDKALRKLRREYGKVKNDQGRANHKASAGS